VIPTFRIAVRDAAPAATVDELRPGGVALPNGRVVFVQPWPGDGTTYGVLLTRGDDGLTVRRVGAPGCGSVRVADDRELTAEDCRPLAPMNAWARSYFAWWLNELRTAGAR